MRDLAPVRSALVVWVLLAACGSAPATALVRPSPTATAPAPSRTAATWTASSRPPEPTAAAVPAGPRKFSIVSAGTTARFRIAEVLRGKAHVVVGRTNQVRGDLVVDRDHPERTSVGPIVIEAGDLATDDELRDSSVRGLILEAGDYPEIVFTPVAIDGLPEIVAVGDRLTFDMTGDLRIRQVSRRETFHIIVDVLAEDRLKGTAAGTIRRSDFALTIPSVPGVAEVSQEVDLVLDFAAVDVGRAE
jgi:polyisoprenoid-binding protein YceI